jgi:Tol biopolymer transport system component
VSRDGTRLFFKTANEMKIATVDFARAGLSDVRTIGDFRGNLHWPVFAPDGDSIRYTLAGPKGGWIYEIRANGRGDRQLKLVAESTSECCGSWTPDGHYYVFQATVEFRTQIWAVHNVRNALPVPIT